MNSQVSYNYGELLERVRLLQQEGRYRTALDQLFPLLEHNQDDENVSFLACLIVYLGQSPGPGVYNAVEPLTLEYLADRRLDTLFCQCYRCGNTWMPNPLIKGVGNLVHNSPGGQCPRCSKVFCRLCSTTLGDSDYKCPECNISLSVVTKPNGRQSLQTNRRETKLKIVVVFREGPVPPDNEYLTKWLRRVSPDVFDDNPEVRAYPVFPWPKTEGVMASEAALLCINLCKSLNIPVPETFDGSFIEPGDDEGNHLYIAKIYEKADSKKFITKPQQSVTRRTGLALTIFSSALCGFPGLFCILMGVMASVISFMPGAEIDINGSSDPMAALIFGLVEIVIGIILVAIPIAIWYFTVRSKLG